MLDPKEVAKITGECHLYHLARDRGLTFGQFFRIVTISWGVRT